jgi:molybdopterin molybdotransferase
MTAIAEPPSSRWLPTGIPWRAARAVAAQAPSALNAEQVPLTAGGGRVLAEPVRAAIAAPAFDTAAMDGYAVAGSGPWQVIGQSLAGVPGPTATLRAGSAVEIATGAVVPAGTDAVLPYERSRRDADTVSGVREGRDHIRRAGEDAQPGDEVAPAGRIVSAAVLGAAAQTGVEHLWVRRRPRIGVLVTGDEVLPYGTAPAIGKVRDAVSPMVMAVVARAGGELVEHRLLGDDRDLLQSAIAAAHVDAIVVSGSSSLGAADHLRSVLAELNARWHVDGVRCRPGHPQTLVETVDGRWVIGLPGNPFAALVAGLTLLEPVVQALSGRTPQSLLRLPLSGDVTPYPSGTRLVPVVLDGGHARTVPGGRAASLRAAAAADAIAVLDPDWTSGSTTDLMLMP